MQNRHGGQSRNKGGEVRERKDVVDAENVVGFPKGSKKGAAPATSVAALRGTRLGGARRRIRPNKGKTGNLLLVLGKGKKKKVGCIRSRKKS